MGFFGNLISSFKNASKAGEEFNPALAATMEKLEQLHADGHLDNVIFEAEQAYKKEHEEYAAKGIHTDAADSQKDVSAMKHFLDALQKGASQLDPSVLEEVNKVLDLRGKMENIIGNAIHGNK